MVVGPWTATTEGPNAMAATLAGTLPGVLVLGLAYFTLRPQ